MRHQETKKNKQNREEPFCWKQWYREKKKEMQHAQESMVAVLRSWYGEGLGEGGHCSNLEGLPPREGGSPDLGPGQVRMGPSAVRPSDF